MEKIHWSGYEWLTQERWGNHTDDKTFWHDPSAIAIKDNILILKTQKNPMYFPDIDKTIPIGVGLVSNTTRFGYGHFEIEAILPTGEYLWPAFWMWSWDSWPPEIDVFEAYTNSKGSYRKKWYNLFSKWKVVSNIHYGKSGKTHREFGGKTHCFGLVNPAKEWIKYSCEWQENSIDFFFNEKHVRSIKDPIVLKDFKSAKMNLILNNAIQEKADLENLKESQFKIKYFKYEAL